MKMKVYCILVNHDPLNWFLELVQLFVVAVAAYLL